MPTQFDKLAEDAKHTRVENMAGLPRAGGGMPTSPFEIEATKEILQRRIENGDIQQSDLDLLKKGYTWMTTASFLGSVGMAIPTYLFFRRKQPPAGLGIRLLAAGGMGMLGSFLGFTVGGAAAAAEVNRSMENPQQKLKVFAEIATEARRASIERSGLPRSSPSSSSSSPFPPSSSSGSGSLGSRPTSRESIGVETSPSTWATESSLDRSEMAAESARETGYKGDIGAIRRDSGFASDRPPAVSSSMGTGGEARVGSKGDSWGQLRKGASGTGGAFPSAEGEGARGMGIGGRGQMRENERLGAGGLSGAGGMEGKQDSRTAEQREFDALLERERRGLGAGGDDKWA